MEFSKTRGEFREVFNSIEHLVFAGKSAKEFFQEDFSSRGYPPSFNLPVATTSDLRPLPRLSLKVPEADLHRREAQEIKEAREHSKAKKDAAKASSKLASIKPARLVSVESKGKDFSALLGDQSEHIIIQDDNGQLKSTTLPKKYWEAVHQRIKGLKKDSKSDDPSSMEVDTTPTKETPKKKRRLSQSLSKSEEPEKEDSSTSLTSPNRLAPVVDTKDQEKVFGDTHKKKK